VIHDDELDDAALRELAQRLGTTAADRLDVDQTAHAVVTRLRQQPRALGRRWTWLEPAWLRIAAAVLVLVGAGVVLRYAGQSPSASAVSVAPGGAELTELSTAQLEELLHTVGQPVGTPETLSAQDAELEDLTAAQLRTLLTSLEG
jgi:hypothetical protein